MIVNVDGTKAVFATQNKLCVCSATSDVIQEFSLSDAKFISVVPGPGSDFFAVIHRWEDDRVEISAHNHADPPQIIARASLRLSPPFQDAKLALEFEGNFSVWGSLPRAFLIYAWNTADRRRLLLIRGGEEENFQELEWHSSNYDTLYQGLVCVAEIPDRRELIITIQRDSNPVLYDPGEKAIIGRLELADRNGNPEVALRRRANEFWISDYDTLVKLDSRTLTVKDFSLIQESAAPMERLFMGKFCFDSKEECCLIARPFSGDAVLLEADSMRRINQFSIGGSPLDICLLTGGTVITREWKTNEVRFHKLA